MSMTGTFVQTQDQHGRIVWENLFPVAAWANPRLGFPQEGHVTTVWLYQNGNIVGMRTVYPGPGREPVGPPPWPAPPTDVEFGPPLKQQQFNGLGLPSDRHQELAEREAEHGVKAFFPHIEEDLEEGDCIRALHNAITMNRSYAVYETHARAGGEMPGPQLRDHMHDLTARVVRKCAIKKGR